MIKVLGIDHVALSVSNLDKSLEFYTKVLGLHVTQREYSKPGIEYFLDCGSSLIGLIQGEKDGARHLFQDKGVGGHHVAFRVSKTAFDGIEKALAERGIAIIYSKKREKSWSLYFQDPDGNRLEITAWPEEDSF